MTQSTIRVYPLFVALTRPAMLGGVTLSFFVFNIVFATLLMMITIDLSIGALSWFFIVGLCGLLHIVGVIGCAQDERFFDLLFGKWNLKNPNQQFWGCRSYDPE